MNFRCRNHPLTRENKQLNKGQRGNLLSSKEFAPLILCCSRAKCTSLSSWTLTLLILSRPAGFCQPKSLLGSPQRASAELQKPALLFLYWKELTQYHTIQQKLVHMTAKLLIKCTTCLCVKIRVRLTSGTKNWTPVHDAHYCPTIDTDRSQQPPRCPPNLCLAAGLCKRILLQFY